MSRKGSWEEAWTGIQCVGRGGGSWEKMEERLQTRLCSPQCWGGEGLGGGWGPAPPLTLLLQLLRYLIQLLSKHLLLDMNLFQK